MRQVFKQSDKIKSGARENFVYVRRPPEAWRRARGGDPIGDDARWLAQLLTAAATDARLTPWEVEFVAGVAERFRTYGEALLLSDRQRSVLREIERKMRR